MAWPYPRDTWLMIDYMYGGRLAKADYGGVEGYLVQYSPTCASSFGHRSVTPNLDYVRYYEGPYEHRLTLPTAEREPFLYHQKRQEDRRTQLEVRVLSRMSESRPHLASLLGLALRVECHQSGKPGEKLERG